MSDPIASTLPEQDIHCPRCGYNLRGCASGVCSECGLEVDLETVGRSVLPWTHRAHRGKTRAFLQTVWLVARHPDRLAADARGPVSYRDAQRFRRLVVLLVSAPLCVGALVIRALTGDTAPPINPSIGWDNAAEGMPFWFDVAICLWAGYMNWAVPSVAILLTFAALSGSGSFFFHPRKLDIRTQNRGIALSYYTCAPLVGMLAGYALMLLCIAMVAMELNEPRSGFRVFVFLSCLAGAAVSIALCLMWFATLRLYQDLVKPSRKRLVATALLLPVLGLVLAALTLVLLPGVVGFFKLIYYSYRS